MEGGVGWRPQFNGEPKPEKPVVGPNRLVRMVFKDYSGARGSNSPTELVYERPDGSRYSVSKAGISQEQGMA